MSIYAKNYHIFFHMQKGVLNCNALKILTHLNTNTGKQHTIYENAHLPILKN